MSALAIAFLFWLIYFREPGASPPAWTASLPAVNAALNFTSAVLLTAGIAAIRGGRRDLHQKLMITTVCVSAAFLASYVVYHHFQGDTRFGGQGFIRPFYFFILVTHIVGSVIALPMVLATLFLAATQRFARHRVMARYTAPLWLYVSVTGVAVFVFLKLWG